MRAISVTLLLTLAALATAKPMTNNNRVNRQQQCPVQVDPSILQRIESTPFRLGEGVNSFSNDIYAELAKTTNGNFAFSPFSLHTALAMTFFGSPADSLTHYELANVLGLRTRFAEDYSYNFLKLVLKYEELTKCGRDGARVSVANRIFADRSFEPKEAYTRFLGVFYRTNVTRVRFADSANAAREVNRFVADKTDGLISRVLNADDVDGLTKMVLVNALYFKSDWQYQFTKAATKPADFTVGEGETFRYARTMFNRGEFGTANLPEISSRILELPYTHPDLRMLVILPNEGVDVRDVGKNLDRLDMATLNRRLAYGPTMIQLPAFDASGEVEVSEVLKNLGVNTLFNPSQADLSDISDVADLAVDKVKHKAVVKVNEEGSEAAAVTSVGIGTRAAGAATSLTPFRVNRPFIFIIQDTESRVPLFVGRVTDPSGRRTLRSRGPTASAGKREAAASILSANIANLPTPPPPAQPQAQQQQQQNNAPVNDELIAELFGSNNNDDQAEEDDDEDPFKSFLPEIVEADEPQPQLAAQESQGGSDLPPCDDSTGFRRQVGPDGEEISFPCRDRETGPVRDHMAAQEREIDGQIDSFLNRS